MPNATVRADARALPESTQSIDAALISTAALYADRAAAFLALPDDASVEIFEAEYNQCFQLGAALSLTRATTNEGVAAKVSVAPLAFKLDSEPEICVGPSSFNGLWESIRLDLRALAVS